MNDTAPEIEEMIHERLMARSASDRFVMGARMFDAARQMILASLPKNLPADELRARLFERVYGQKLEVFIGH
ncbi:MAG: hypothetical protein ABI042_10640 [Verrucomicrobiota bacterium]